MVSDPTQRLRGRDAAPTVQAGDRAPIAGAGPEATGSSKGRWAARLLRPRRDHGDAQRRAAGAPVERRVSRGSDAQGSAHRLQRRRQPAEDPGGQPDHPPLRAGRGRAGRTLPRSGAARLRVGFPLPKRNVPQRPQRAQPFVEAAARARRSPVLDPDARPSPHVRDPAAVEGRPGPPRLLRLEARLLEGGLRWDL